jgi:predicted GNAT family acetyltransferase
VADPPESLRIVDNPELRRYEAYLDDELAGFSDYRLAPGRVVFTHTEVDPRYGGRGIGSHLVRAELDESRRRGLKVTPVCPFVRAFMRRHADYHDLLNAPLREPAAP